jgi:hypothetical protein
LLPHLESVPLPFIEVLYESGEAIEHVYSGLSIGGLHERARVE